MVLLSVVKQKVGCVDMNEQNQETLKYALDGASLLTVIGTLVEFLPALSAILSIVWVAIRIYETETVKKLLNRKKDDDAEHK
jgi:tetrahydromethanopterin S-methyltransferase subunit C